VLIRITHVAATVGLGFLSVSVKEHPFSRLLSLKNNHFKFTPVMTRITHVSLLKITLRVDL
jgi:hypothetical protein